MFLSGEEVRLVFHEPSTFCNLIPPILIDNRMFIVFGGGKMEAMVTGVSIDCEHEHGRGFRFSVDHNTSCQGFKSAKPT